MREATHQLPLENLPDLSLANILIDTGNVLCARILVRRRVKSLHARKNELEVDEISDIIFHSIGKYIVEFANKCKNRYYLLRYIHSVTKSIYPNVLKSWRKKFSPSDELEDLISKLKGETVYDITCRQRVNSTPFNHFSKIEQIAFSMLMLSVDFYSVEAFHGRQSLISYCILSKFLGYDPVSLLEYLEKFIGPLNIDERQKSCLKVLSFRLDRILGVE